MKKVTIEFKSMKLSEDGRTVIIKGVCLGHHTKIEISILQLAKIFGTDRKVGNKLSEIGFGSEELEDECDETRDYVKKFPEITVWERELEFPEVSVEDESWAERSTDPEIIWIHAEDIKGWSNEGLRIDFPKKIYDSELKGKNFGVYATPFYVYLRKDDRIRMSINLPIEEVIH